MARDFNFCPRCAAAFERREVHSLVRLVCPQCDFVFWQNPAVGVAVIVLREDTILLGRRSRGAYRGMWCIPCGYVEYDEHVRDAAQREFLEETGLQVRIGEVYTVHSNFHNPAMHTVGIWFMGEVVAGHPRAADDLDAVEFVHLARLPREIAFATDRLVLEQLRRERGVAVPGDDP